MTQPARHSPRTIQWVALVGVASASFPITVLSAALARIADDLGSDVSTVTWVIAGPLLAFAVFTPMVGKLGDIHGHRRVFLIGFSGAAIMSVATALAWGATSLIAFRIVGQGFAAATGPSALAIILSVYGDERRTHVAGVWSAVAAASPAVGVIVGGPLIDLTSWQILFLLQAAWMVLAVALAWRILPTTERRADHRFDLLGGMLLAAGAGTLLVAVNRGIPLGWDHPAVVAGLVASPILLTGFVTWERRVQQPLIRLDAVGQRNVALPLASQLFLNGPYMAGLVLTGLLLAVVFDLDTTAVSLMILPRPLCFALSASLAGRIVDRAGGRATVTIGTASVAAGLALTGLGAAREVLWLVGVGVGFAGAGSGLARPPIIAALTEAVGPRDVGVGTGLLNMVSQLGAAAGISVLSALVTAESSADRFLTVFAISAMLALGAVALSATIRFAGSITAPPAPIAPTAPYSAVLVTNGPTEDPAGAR